MASTTIHTASRQQHQSGGEAKKLWEHAGFVSLGIGAVTNGVQWAALSFIEPALTLYEIIGRTLPLTMALTIFVLSSLDKPGFNGAFHPMAAAAIFAGCAWLSVWVGAADRNILPSLSHCDPNATLQPCTTDSWVTWPFRFIANYWQIYGGRLFISSCITAGFVGYCIDRLGKRAQPAAQ